MVDASAFKTAFIEYMAYISSNTKTISQRKADDLFGIADDFVPNARLTELCGYSEVDRTDDDLIEEALRRQRIFEDEGEISLLLKVREQQVSALTNPEIIPRHKNSAKGNIDAIDAELKDLRDKLN